MRKSLELTLKALVSLLLRLKEGNYVIFFFKKYYSNYSEEFAWRKMNGNIAMSQEATTVDLERGVNSLKQVMVFSGQNEQEEGRFGGWNNAWC